MTYRIVICGAGIGGVPAAYVSKSRLGAQAAVTVIGNGADFQFTPSNPWVVLGWRAHGEVAFSIGPYLATHGIDFISVAAQRIDASKKCVVLTDGNVVQYDFLVLATGPDPDFDAIPGLGPRGFTQSVMRTEDADHACTAYRTFLRNPGPVVIGAAQESRILGPVYELAFLIDADMRRRHLRRQASISLVSPEPYPGHLGIGGDGESRRLLEQALSASEIEFVGNAVTERVEHGRVHLQIADAGTRELPFGYSVYWPAFRGVPALLDSPELCDERGLVLVDDYLRSPDHPEIFAVGVCVARPPLTQTPVPIGAPESVYSIQGEVDTAVHNIEASISGAPLTSARPQRARWISDLGEDGARYLSQPHVPLRDVNWLRRGTWVPLAKTEFERYFINKIKLGTERAGATGARVVAIVRQMESQRTEYHAESTESATKQLRVALSNEQTQELEALARVLGRNPEALASELLRASIGDALENLGDRAREDLEQARREVLLDRITGREAGVHFQGGAP